MKNCFINACETVFKELIAAQHAFLSRLCLYYKGDSLQHQEHALLNFNLFLKSVWIWYVELKSLKSEIIRLFFNQTIQQNA